MSDTSVPWERLRNQLPVWRALGASAGVLKLIAEGVKPTMKQPCAPYDMGCLWLEGSELAAWHELEQKYLSLGAIVRDDELDYVNAAFMIPKSSGGYRLIVDLRPFNECNVDYPTEFDTLHSLRNDLKPNDLLSTFDLADGYFHLAIHPGYQQYFGFRINGKGYRMLAVPFGWSRSPQAFMQLTRQIGQFLSNPTPLLVNGVLVKSEPIRHRILLDDFLLMYRNLQQADRCNRYVQVLLQLLGVGVNESKSSWQPEKVKLHLGLYIDTEQCMFYVPEGKLTKIRDCAKGLLSEACKHGRWVPARSVAKMCGLVMCISLAFKGAHYFTRCLYDDVKLKSGWGAKVRISNQSYKHLKFFSKLHKMWNGKSIWPASVTVSLISDASDVGWGARAADGKEAHGYWSEKTRPLHIMTRECYAVYYGLSTFKTQYANQVVDVVCDNTAVVHSLRNFSARSQQLMKVLGLIFWLCHRHNITVVPRWIGSASNVVDALSRLNADDEWRVASWLFDWVQMKFGRHDIDRFASDATTMLPRYNSVFWDPKTEGVDALAQDWSHDNNYANPPFSLINQVVKKLGKYTSVRCTLLVPDWPSKPWYLPLMLMAKAVHVIPAGTWAFQRQSTQGEVVKLRAKWPVLVVRVQKCRRSVS